MTKGWWRIAPYAVGIAMAAATLLVPISWNLPRWAAATTIANSLFGFTALSIVLSIALLPAMGKREFLTRYGGIPAYLRAYLQRRPWWVLWAHVISCAAGLVIVVVSWSTVSPRSTFIHNGGKYYILTTSGTREAVSSQQYFVSMAASHVWMTAGAAVFFMGLLLIFLCADRYLGARPNLWPASRSSGYTRWYRMFKSHN